MGDGIMKPCFARSVTTQVAQLVLCAVSFGVAAQSYPSKPIRVVVPFVPGGGSDTLGRLIAQKLSEGFKQQAFVDNRGGAGGRLGADLVAKAAPDGYTLLFTGSGALMVAPALYEKLAYDPQKDFAPIALVASSAYVLLVHPAVPVRSLKQLIALCRAKPGLLNYASAGLGAPGHLSGELFQSMAGVRMAHVPYKGTAPSITDLIGGRVSVSTASTVSMMPHVNSGRLYALAVVSSKRSQAFPRLPTVAEAGIPGYAVDTWYGVFVPAATPKEIVAKLFEEIARTLRQPEVKGKMLAMGLEPVGSPPEQFAAYVRAEVEKWAKFVRDADVRIN